MFRTMRRWCSREGSLVSPPPHSPPRGRTVSLAVSSLGFAIVAVLALETPGDVLAEPRQGDDQPTQGTGDVRCPDCNKKGRARCPQCEGKGLLARNCPACNASGRRPCKVCTDGASADSPGRLVCPSCGGAGAVGDDARTCSRCKGAQTVICNTCLGKGSHHCRKRIFDTVCPTCRFSGKISCPTCEGQLWLAPAVLASRKARAASLKNSAPKTASSTNGSGASANSSYAAPGFLSNWIFS